MFLLIYIQHKSATRSVPVTLYSVTIHPSKSILAISHKRIMLPVHMPCCYYLMQSNTTNFIYSRRVVYIQIFTRYTSILLIASIVVLNKNVIKVNIIVNFCCRKCKLIWDIRQQMCSIIHTHIPSFLIFPDL